MILRPVRLRAADYKAAGGVDVILGVLVQQLGGNGGTDHIFHNVGVQLFVAHLRAVLAGDDHGVHANGLAVVIFHRHLAFAVRAQIIHQAALAHLSKALGKLVCQADGHGHQLGGLVAGITKHHALVARAAHFVVGAQRNVGALGVNAGDHTAGFGIKAVFGTHIADVCDHAAGNGGDIHIALGGDLTHHMHKAGGAGGFAGHTGIGIFGENGVQHSIADLVANFVGMSFGNGLRSKQGSTHSLSPFRLWPHSVPPGKITGSESATRRKQKNSQPKGSERINAYLPVSRRIWHLAVMAGCRASQGLFPQPLLISCYSVFASNIITQRPGFVNEQF